MEKINYPKVDSEIILHESSYEQATRILQSICKLEISDQYIVILRVACYMKKHKMIELVNELTYPIFVVNTAVSGLYRWLPISKQNYMLIFDVKISDIDYFFDFCKEDYPMFEVLLIQRNQYDEKVFAYLKETTLNLFYSIYYIRNLGLDMFFCGFDFDDPNFESGVSRAYYANFVPSSLSLYF